eukprot:5629290-Lingulodinium_polyedra.AAC.1
MRATQRLRAMMLLSLAGSPSRAPGSVHDPSALCSSIHALDGASSTLHAHAAGRPPQHAYSGTAHVGCTSVRMASRAARERGAAQGPSR